MIPNRFDAYQLFHQGTVAFARMESVGLRVDLAYLARKKGELQKEFEATENKLKASKLGRIWGEHYANINFRSPQQTQKILFDVLKLPVIKETEKGNAQVDEEVLLQYKDEVPGVADLLTLRAIHKTLFTYVSQIEQETFNGELHPFFNLHIARTYRSSSNGPNFQNMPIRDPKFGELIRSAIKPPPGFQLGEIDYSGLEVRIAACVTKDPKLMAYVTNPKLDMHRDTAQELFILPVEDITKPIRHIAKNGFVFPQFYGSYYVQCAKQIWEESRKIPFGLETLRDHLANNKMGTLKRFERHVQSVEDAFWNKRFPVYDRWRETQYNQYQKVGYLDTVTGFRCGGLMSRNQISNYGIQGPAFHCLLWSLIQLDKEIRKRKWKSRIVGQIHDSVILIIHPPELKELLAVVEYIMSQALLKHWGWITVPLDVEIEVAPVNGSWYEKKKWETTK